MVKKTTGKTIVIAIGGNSLIKNGKQSASFQEQLETVKQTTANIAEIVKRGARVIITHGNGPQVGDILIRSYLTRAHLPDIPLDMANAITQSEIGYMIQQALKNELAHRKITKPVVTIVTQVIVNKDDPAFLRCTKPVGPFYSKKDAFALQAERKWNMTEDAGRGYRRLVSSPEPIEIVEIGVIRTLLEAGAVIIAAGGGGIPVFRQGKNQLVPTAAVIDKDLTSAVLANLLDADILLISTSIEQAFINFNKPNQKPLFQISSQQAKNYYNQGHFGNGSMGPKILAGLKFIDRNKKRIAIITNPENLNFSLNNAEIGTRIQNNGKN
jgi:carbamate kinase